MSKEVAKEYLQYKRKMEKIPNDTVLTRWGMYSEDPRYREETARIVKMIMDDMHINSKQGYYMLYFMISNNLEDYERAKEDMYVDEDFHIYKKYPNQLEF